MKPDTQSPENNNAESKKAPSHFKKFIDFFFEEHPERDMSAETYESNIQRREAIIRNHSSKYIFLFIMSCSILLFFLMSVVLYGEMITQSDISFIAFYTREHPELFIFLLMFGFFLPWIGFTVYTYLQQEELSKIEAHIYAYERFILRKNIEADMYESSIQMSYKYLDQYYQETREQATRGFRITVGVCVIGAAIVIIGIALMAFKVTTAAYVTTASGVIIEFISSIFFHLYNKTIQSMGNYHNKLILSQNVAIALKISETIEGPEKNAVKVDMIKALTADINQHINSNKPVE